MLILITPTLSPQEIAYTYASEADILNLVQQLIIG